MLAISPTHRVSTFSVSRHENASNDHQTVQTHFASFFAAVDYLLAPEAKFPGSIVQGLAAWFYLTRQLGYHPSQIIIGGDSYGSEVTLSLTRFLLTEFPGYEGYDIESHGSRTGERPAALLLLSPFCDATNDSANPPPCYERNKNKDIILFQYGEWGHTERGLFYGKEAQGRTRTLKKNDPWFTFINMPDEELKNFPPMWVGNGGNGESCLDTRYGALAWLTTVSHATSLRTAD